MNTTSSIQRTRLSIAITTALTLAVTASISSALLAQAPSVAPSTPSTAAQTAPLQPAAPAATKDGTKDKAKDVVLDAAPATGPAPGGRIVPAPDARRDANAGSPPSAPRNATAIAQTPAAAVHGARVEQYAAGLGDLGMALLRTEGGASSGNAVVSPFSIANALGMAHAGAVGHTRDQIAALVEPRSAQGRTFTHGAASLNRALTNVAPGVELASANRIWVNKPLASQLATPYVATLRDSFGADGAMVDFSQSEPARSEINRWIAEHTKGHIKDLLPGGSIKASTRAVLTNAVYLRGKWRTAFDAGQTADRPFRLDGGRTINVPTMVGQVALRTGVVDGLTVFELPYQGEQFALMIALPPEGHTLQALESDTAGADIAGWSKRLEAVAQASFQLPKFRLEPTTVALADRLKALGMVAAFDQGANFSGITGKANEIQLEQVFHAAGIIVDEAGSEATAATAAVMTAKSLSLPSPRAYKVDRPFLFAIVHKPTGAPLFVGKVANPVAGTH